MPTLTALLFMLACSSSTQATSPSKATEATPETPTVVASWSGGDILSSELDETIRYFGPSLTVTHRIALMLPRLYHISSVLLSS